MGDCFLEDGVHSSLILMAGDGFDGPDGFQMHLDGWTLMALMPSCLSGTQAG